MSRWLQAALRVPVFVKIMGIAVGLTLLLAAGMAWQIHRTWRVVLARDVETRARRAAGDLASHGAAHLIARNVVELQHLVRDVEARTPGIAYVLVVDARGVPVAGSLPAPASAELLAANAVAGGRASAVRLETELGPVMDVAWPVLDGRPGAVRVGVREEPSRREVAGLVGRLALGIAIIAAAGMLAAWALARAITRPLRGLVALTDAVRQGDYAARAPVGARDEIGTLAGAFNEMTRALAEKERTRQELLRRVIAAGEEERRRVSRDLHDDAGQMVVSLIAGLGAAEAEATDPKQRRRIAELRETASRTLEGLHAVAVDLRPSVLDDVGLAAALRRHAGAVAKRSGIEVTTEGLDAEPSPRLAPEVETALYRIAQEAFTNAVRHGEARRITVALELRDGRAVLAVEDDGAGFEPGAARSEDRLGLLGIEERAGLLGGTLRVDSRTGGGTRIEVDIPIVQEARRGEDPDPRRG